MGDGNETRKIILKDYTYPTGSTQHSCITLSALTTNFEIKSGMIQILSVFRGLANENSYQYVKKFEDICGTMKYNHMTEESLKIRLFPFSLKTLDWFNFYLELKPSIESSTPNRRLLLYVKPLTLFINKKGRRFSHTLKDSRIFYSNVLTMDLKKFVYPNSVQKLRLPKKDHD